MESGEYFLSKEQKDEAARLKKREKMEAKTEERKGKRMEDLTPSAENDGGERRKKRKVEEASEGKTEDVSVKKLAKKLKKKKIGA